MVGVDRTEDRHAKRRRPTTTRKDTLPTASLRQTVRRQANRKTKPSTCNLLYMIEGMSAVKMRKKEEVNDVVVYTLELSAFAKKREPCSIPNRVWSG